MAININRVTLLGRVGKDPERRGGSDGPVSFSVATSESWKDKRTGEKREKTQWTNVTVWNEFAQKFCLDYVRKGDQVYVEGQLETREYDKDGEKRYATDVVVKPFSGVVQSQSKERRESSSDRSENSDSGNRSDYGSGGGYGGGSRDLDDEIPF